MEAVAVSIYIIIIIVYRSGNIGVTRRGALLAVAKVIKVLKITPQVLNSINTWRFF